MVTKSVAVVSSIVSQTVVVVVRLPSGREFSSPSSATSSSRPPQNLVKAVGASANNVRRTSSFIASDRLFTRCALSVMKSALRQDTSRLGLYARAGG